MLNELLILFWRIAHRFGYEPGSETPRRIVPLMPAGAAGHERWSRLFGRRYRHFSRGHYQGAIFWEQLRTSFEIYDSYAGQISKIQKLVGRP